VEGREKKKRSEDERIEMEGLPYAGVSGLAIRGLPHNVRG